MHLLTDCQACGGPCPLGSACPHCGSRPRRGSLRELVLRFAMVGFTACSPFVAMSAYGVSVTPCPVPVGETCFCEDQACRCDDAGVCAPIPSDPCAGHSTGEVCACDGGTCTCSAAGVCAPYLFLPDAGVDGG